MDLSPARSWSPPGASCASAAGAARVRRGRAGCPLPKAANPFESVLRAITIEAGLQFEAQHGVEVTGMTLHPDLVSSRPESPRGRLVEFHTGREAHARLLAVQRVRGRGVAGLRFTWWHVMEQPDYVLDVLSRVYRQPLRRAEVPDTLARSA